MDKDNDKLAFLPDDVLLDIVEHFSTARDVARLSTTCRRANNLISREGWNPFIHQRFPTLKLPAVTEPGQWRGVADRLTHLSKCWEKRAFVLSQYTERKRDDGGGRGWARQSVAPSTIVEAGVLEEQGKEAVAWAAGENLVVQTVPCHGKHVHKKRRWREQLGASLGHRPGTGDITALSIIDGEGSPSIAVGRADGSLRLQSLRFEDFGQVRRELELPLAGRKELRQGAVPSPGQSSVSWTEWNAWRDVLVAGQGSTVALYDLSDTSSTVLTPAASKTMSSGDGTDLGLVRSVKFMDGETIAMALGGSTEPLRCAKLTPTGLESLGMGLRNPKVDDALRLHHGIALQDGVVPRAKRTSVRAIEPVGRPGRGDLLLSAWDDGTYRLHDIRTPSAQDAVYCNRLHSYEGGSSLLVYGMERFIAGSNVQPNILFFDFRQPTAYHWTAAAACSSEEPYPPPPGTGGGTRLSDAAQRERSSRCTTSDRKMCIYHASSLSDYYRPDATLQLGSRTYDRIHSLAKASDLSTNFWVGLRGAVYESRWMLAEDASVNSVKTSHPPPRGWQVGKPEVKVTLVETEMGLRHSEDWRDDAWDMNLSHWQFRLRKGKVGEKERRARLDPSVATFQGGPSSRRDATARNGRGTGAGSPRTCQ